MTLKDFKSRSGLALVGASGVLAVVALGGTAVMSKAAPPAKATVTQNVPAEPADAPDAAGARADATDATDAPEAPGAETSGSPAVDPAGGPDDQSGAQDGPNDQSGVDVTQ